jgi:nitric oxide reductase NorE protein
MSSNTVRPKIAHRLRFEIGSGTTILRPQVTASAKETGSGDIVDRRSQTPGETGIWIFILLDMLIFAEMFCIFVWYRAGDRELFEASRHAVNPAYGLVYTLLLLTSSWCVVLAVSAARKRLFDTASALVLWAVGLGAAFVVIKLVEYGAKVSGGITPITNQFFMFYFVLTFVHLLHASVGLGVLTYMRGLARALRRSCVEAGQRPMRMIEVSGIYWHMVDLLWIVLFALFYLRG